jgi:hypothetical protein
MGNFSSHQHGPKCSCDLSLVIFSSKQLEALLETKFGGTGKGLHEKITSSRDLPETLKRKLRRVATIRNKLVHERKHYFFLILELTPKVYSWF